MRALSKINIQNLKIYKDELRINISYLLKISRLGSVQPCLNIPFLRQRPEICPAETMLAYINRTKAMRSGQDLLLISFKKPFNAVSAQTISRWIKETLSKSGIDTSILAHIPPGTPQPQPHRGLAST